MKTITKIAIRQMEYTPGKGEVNNLPSETIQGQSLSVNEILIKFSQGTLPDIVHEHYYDDDPDFDAIDPTLSPDFDLSDTDIYRDFKMDKEVNTEPENTVTEEVKDYHDEVQDKIRSLSDRLDKFHDEIKNYPDKAEN